MQKCMALLFAVLFAVMYCTGCIMVPDSANSTTSVPQVTQTQLAPTEIQAWVTARPAGWYWNESINAYTYYSGKDAVVVVTLTAGSGTISSGPVKP